MEKVSLPFIACCIELCNISFKILDSGYGGVYGAVEENSAGGYGMEENGGEKGSSYLCSSENYELSQIILISYLLLVLDNNNLNRFNDCDQNTTKAIIRVVIITITTIIIITKEEGMAENTEVSSILLLRIEGLSNLSRMLFQLKICYCN